MPLIWPLQTTKPRMSTEPGTDTVAVTSLPAIQVLPCTFQVTAMEFVLLVDTFADARPAASAASRSMLSFASVPPKVAALRAAARAASVIWMRWEYSAPNWKIASTISSRTFATSTSSTNACPSSCFALPWRLMPSLIG